MDDLTLCARVRLAAVERLGDRVAAVEVDVVDDGAEVCIRIVSPEGWVHAVQVDLPIGDPMAGIGCACDALQMWLGMMTATHGTTATPAPGPA